MCVRCPGCSGGLGGRQPSRSHLKKQNRRLHKSSSVHLKHHHLTDLCVRTVRVQLEVSVCLLSCVIPHRSQLCEQLSTLSAPPSSQSHHIQPHRWNVNKAAKGRARDTPAYLQSCWPNARHHNQTHPLPAAGSQAGVFGYDPVSETTLNTLNLRKEVCWVFISGVFINAMKWDSIWKRASLHQA